MKAQFTEPGRTANDPREMKNPWAIKEFSGKKNTMDEYVQRSTAQFSNYGHVLNHVINDVAN